MRACNRTSARFAYETQESVAERGAGGRAGLVPVVVLQLVEVLRAAHDHDVERHERREDVNAGLLHVLEHLGRVGLHERRDDVLLERRKAARDLSLGRLVHLPQLDEVRVHVVARPNRERPSESHLPKLKVGSADGYSERSI